MGGTVDHKGGRHLVMPLWNRRKQIKVAGDPRFDWAIRRCAMNMSVMEFVVPPAIVGRNRSVWREIIDTVMEGPAIGRARADFGGRFDPAEWRTGLLSSPIMETNAGLPARRERPRDGRAAECGQQFPPSDGDCHAPLPCEGA